MTQDESRGAEAAHLAARWANFIKDEGLDIYFGDGSMIHIRLDCCTPEKLAWIASTCATWAAVKRREADDA